MSGRALFAQLEACHDGPPTTSRSMPQPTPYGALW